MFTDHCTPSVIRVVFLSLLGATLLLPLTAFADKGDCDEGSSEPLWDCEEQLNLAQGELIYEFTGLVGELEEMQAINPAFLMIESSNSKETTSLGGYLNNLDKENARAYESIHETPNQDFEDMVAQGGKEKGQKCSWVEADDVALNPEDYLPAGLSDPSDDLGNSKCDRFDARNAEGDTVKISERSQPNICIRQCADRDVTDKGGNTLNMVAGQSVKKKERIKKRHLARKNEGLDSTHDATDAVRGAKADLMMLNARVSAFGVKTALESLYPECQLPDDTAKVVAWHVKTVTAAILPILIINARIADGVADTAEPVTRQDVLGNNASSANVPAVIYKQVSEGLVQAAEVVMLGADLTMEGFDLFSNEATHNCVVAIRAQVDGIDEGVNDLKRQVMENREYIRNIREIVLTPHGQRDRLPIYEAPETD